MTSRHSARFALLVAVVGCTSTEGSLFSPNTGAMHDDPPPGAVNLGDLDGDGHDDFAVFTKDEIGVASYSLYYGPVSAGQQPDAVLAGAPEGVIGDAGYVVSAGDLDGDGRPDFIISSFRPEPLDVFYGGHGRLASGTLAERADAVLPLPVPPTSMASPGSEAEFDQDRILVGDFDRDGRSDLMLTRFLIRGQWNASDEEAASEVFYGARWSATVSAPDAIRRIPSADVPLVWHASDVDGDGFCDLTLGIQQFDLSFITHVARGAAARLSGDKAWLDEPLL